MGAADGATSEPGEFADFLRAIEPRLLHALIAAYGPVAGREAALDALSWAWEHWSRVAALENQLGYLYRVGNTAARRNASRPAPPLLQAVPDGGLPDIEPSLVP